jgi:hypothetical protein
MCVRGTVRRGKMARGDFHSSARQVPLYCFRLDKCGTFMPLSSVRRKSRIAVVWTLFVAAFSAVSSVHFSILFTRAVALSAVDRGNARQ